MDKLAIFRGTPVSNKKLEKPSSIGKKELQISIQVLKNGTLSRAGRGKFVKKFENEFANFFKTKYAISTTSGTTALHTALSAIKITSRDEVLVPSLTFVSSASIILQQNAVPVFVDINPNTFCIDVNDLEKKITKKTKAIIVVHLYGCPADIKSIMKIAKKYKLKIIEDCAQAHGARYNNHFIGTFGSAGCFSFYQTKNMTTGEGGMVITNNKALYERGKSIVDHGLIKGKLENYNYDQLGYNYHLTELQAAIGIIQLKKLTKMNKMRRKNALLYKKLLRGSNLFFQEEPKDSESVYYCLTALLPKKFSKYRDWFVEAVRAENVEINKLYPVPLHKTNVFKKYRSKCPVTEDVCSRLFNFYTKPYITKKYIKLTCKAVKKVLRYMETQYE